MEGNTGIVVSTVQFLIMGMFEKSVSNKKFEMDGVRKTVSLQSIPYARFVRFQMTYFDRGFVVEHMRTHTWRQGEKWVEKGQRTRNGNYERDGFGNGQSVESGFLVLDNILG